MVVKIYAAAPSCGSAVGYNERKVAEGKASVLSSSAIENPEKPMETFQMYENGSLRCQNKSFHASVNPGEGEHLTDEQIKEFVKEYMEKMGYGNQPYIVYKHFDLDRTHYHIVSVRVDENGHKIPDTFERRRSQQALKELAEKYDFSVTKQKKQDKTEEDAGASEKVEEKTEEKSEGNDGEKKEGLTDFNPYDGFDPEKGEISEQISAIIKLALSYHFTVPTQFDLVMEHYSVRVIRAEFEGHETIKLQGIDPKTKEPCTPPMEPPEEDAMLEDAVGQHAEFCKTQIKDREKEKVGNLGKAARKIARSESHYINYLKKCGITAILSKNIKGQIFGVTFIDHKNKCVFKGSEVGIKASELENDRQNKWYDEKKDANNERKTVLEETADLMLTALGSERSRHYEDEKIFRQGKKDIK